MLTLALLLDALIGEPDALWRRVPHPVVLMGQAIEWLERRLNSGGMRRAKGMLAVLALIVGAGIVAAFLSLDIFFGVFEVLGAAILIAQKSLVSHVRRVGEALGRSLEEARREVSMIVGRDPETLDAHGVARAAIESAAENFSDGVVAPVFWFALFGLPGIAIYKAVNTADSMIGHLSARYREFGWAAARLDDLMNWVPARLTGLIFCALGGGREALAVMERDADLHRSPNAGWPEAGMAASIGVSLAGPRIYEGVITDDPWINVIGTRDATAAHIENAIELVWKSWCILVAFSIFWWGLGQLFFG